MVAIAPFRALRYDLERVSDLGTVLAPPYDVISPGQQQQLYERSPYNVVRLILNKELPTDSDADNRYTRAKRTFEAWRREQMLVRDRAPGVYLCEHAFFWQGRTMTRLGFLAVLAFDGSVPDGVLRHEATFERAKTDRALLLDAVQANLSPIFCVYEDRGGAVYELLDQWRRQHEPSMQAQMVSASEAPASSGRAAADRQAEEIRLWAVTEAEPVRRLQELMRPQRVLIADGHHRFEVALSRRDRAPGVMTYFAWSQDPGLLVQPIHRVMRIPPSARPRWQATLDAMCTRTPVSNREELVQGLTPDAPAGTFGYYEAGRYERLTVQASQMAAWAMDGSVPLALANLDVTILHRWVLPHAIGDHETARQRGGSELIRYTPDVAAATVLVDAGDAECAWILRPIPVDGVFALAAQGLTLPQKSTYFYPKVLSGLAIHPFDEDPAVG